MKNYRLLGDPPSFRTTRNYRGTYRPGPYFVENLSKTAPINKMWLEKLDGNGEIIFDNQTEAETMQDAFASHGFFFDLILVLDENDVEEGAAHANLMGYDISSASGYSLLSWNLIFDHPTPEYWHYRYDPPYTPLLKLITGYFYPRLNQSGLFSTLDDARFFLDVANTMTKGFGEVWENKEYGPFNVVSVVLIRGREVYLNK